MAGYRTPDAAAVTARYLGVPDIPVASKEGIAGFVLGLIGMTICEELMRWARICRDVPPPALPPLIS